MILSSILNKQNFKNWLLANQLVLKLSLLIILLTLIMIWSIAWSFVRQQSSEPTRLGFSYSLKYAQELGIDPKQGFLTLLNDLNPDRVRLMSYWDAHEPTNDNFDFSQLDWQFTEAEKRGVAISLSLGQRQPRWPECHIPVWAQDLSEDRYQNELLEFISVVVDRYRSSPALESWQLENEAANRLFGDCPAFDDNTLRRELEQVRLFDKDHPVAINASNQSGVPLFGTTAEAVGFSIYKRAHFEAFGRQNGWSFWYVPAYWHSFRAGLAEGLTGAKPFIHELQAEPWGPEATVNLSLSEQNKTMDSKKLVDIVNFAKATGMKDIDFWGAEWWYWRLTAFDDQNLWITVTKIYND